MILFAHDCLGLQIFSLLLITGEEYSFSLDQYLSQQGIFHLLTCKEASGNPSKVFQPPSSSSSSRGSSRLHQLLHQSETPPWVTSTTVVENMATIEKVERWCDYIRRVLKTLHYMNLTPVQRLQYTEQQQKVSQSLQRIMIQNQLYLKYEQIRGKFRKELADEEARKVAEEKEKQRKQKERDEMNYSWAKNSQAWIEEEKKSAQSIAWLSLTGLKKDKSKDEEDNGEVKVVKKNPQEISAMIAKALQTCDSTSQKNDHYFQKTVVNT